MNTTTKITRTIVVTGANKGIGYGIVKGLLTSPSSQHSRIVLTSRNEELGKKAFDTLAMECSKFNISERLVYH